MPPRSKNFHQLKRILISHRDKARERFHQKHRHIKRILKKHQISIEDVRQKGTQVMATGAIAGALMATPTPNSQKVLAASNDNKDANTALQEEKRKAMEKKKLVTKVFDRYGPGKLVNENKAVDIQVDVTGLFRNDQAASRIKEIASQIDKNVSPQYEDELSSLFQDYYGINSAASLDGKRLNTYFGAIGQEQHLPRFAGDNAAGHSDDPIVQRYGITPGRGAWGWWTNSKSGLTQEMIDQEKYYIAAQTFLAPGWRENSNELYNWFKFRKVLLVNPRNNKAVVAVIGDAGPASWTGKSFGGSPEVMRSLESVDGRGVKDVITGQGGAKDNVFVYFVNDPENKVPLGPVSSEVLLAEK